MEEGEMGCGERKNLTLDGLLSMLNLPPDDVLNVYLYGSRLWGTAGPDADYDFVVVMRPEWCSSSPDPLHKAPRVDALVYNALVFEEGLQDHVLYLLLCLCLPPEFVWLERRKFELRVSLPKLRSAVSAEASRTWVKARKKWNIEDNIPLSKKDILHAIRDLLLGAELAETGTIKNYGVANELSLEMRNETSTEWDYYKKKYQPIYNKAGSRLKAAAPKAEGVEPRRTFLLNPTTADQLQALREKVESGRTLLP